MKKLVILVSVFLSACSTTIDSNKMAYDKALTLAKQQWEENSGNPQYKEYFNTWNEYNNANKLDEKDGCYKYSKDPVKFVLVQNRDGVVEQVVTQGDDKKTNCFVKSYTGIKFPKPPLAPFYHPMTMN